MTTGIAIRQLTWILAKDLRIEARSRQSLGLVLVLGILIVVVLGLGLSAQGGGPAANALPATSVLWTAYLFSGVLCFEKTMGVERTDAALAGLMMAPVDRSVIYFAKLLGNLILMLTVAAIVTAAGVLFFSFDLSAAPASFTAVMSLGLLGFAAVGTLFSALVSSTRLQGGLLALTVFPLSLPLVVASTQTLLRVFRDHESVGGQAFAIIVAFDVIFLVASWILFEWILEP